MNDPRITAAVARDLAAVAALVNSAYRGDSSRAGWTTEADYIGGQRTSAADLADDLAGPGDPTILVLRKGGSDAVLACTLVSSVLRADGGTSGYIGMLTVGPGLQDRGVGRIMLTAAEDEARRRGADRARMTVVSRRDSLIAWYERRGYRRTGETAPFPYGDPRFGEPHVEGLEFLILQKILSA